MVAKLLSVVVLATCVLAAPNHKRHNRFHHGTGNGWAMPTGGAFPISNGTAPNNGTDFGGAPMESPSSVEATSVPVLTLTVSPTPLDTGSPNTGGDISSAPAAIAVPSSTAVAPAGDSPAASPPAGPPAGFPAGSPPEAPGSGDDSCSILTSTITSTSVQYVTVTATGDSGSEVAPTGSAEGAPTGGAGGFPSGPSDGAGGFYGMSSSSSSVAAASGGPGEFFPASSSSTTASALSSTTGSISAGSPAAGEFFPQPGQQTSYSYGGGSFPSYGGGAPSAVPTTMATFVSNAPSSAGASASSAAPSSSPSSSPATGGSTSGKKGLSYNTASLTNAFAGKGISWAYNWGSSPDGSIVSGAEYVPMFWGQQSVSGWASAAASAIAGGSMHALSLNEPDLSSQSNVDPATAAALHIANMNPLAGQVQIGSPAVTNGAGTSPLMGIDWLNAFFKACAGQCKVDFVAFHWYDDANNMAYFQSHVNDVIAAAQQNGVGKVWLTEFGASGSDSDVANFITEATSFLDSTAAVERYAYFMCSDGILVNGNSISSPVGDAYA